jgi:hypothetical protein
MELGEFNIFKHVRDTKRTHNIISKSQNNSKLLIWVSCVIVLAS